MTCWVGYACSASPRHLADRLIVERAGDLERSFLRSAIATQAGPNKNAWSENLQTFAGEDSRARLTNIISVRINAPSPGKFQLPNLVAFVREVCLPVSGQVVCIVAPAAQGGAQGQHLIFKLGACFARQQVQLQGHAVRQTQCPVFTRDEQRSRLPAGTSEQCHF